jgi:hypothetical protein
LVECVILIVVLLITMGAVMTTMQWGSRSYAFAKEDMERKQFLFNWCQAFESFYPGVTNDVNSAFAMATSYLGGSWEDQGGVANFKNRRIFISQLSADSGVVTVRLTSNQGTGTAGFVLDRRFNDSSRKTVSDDDVY